jgi:hypothetical protein
MSPQRPITIEQLTASFYDKEIETLNFISNSDDVYLDSGDLYLDTGGLRRFTKVFSDSTFNNFSFNNCPILFLCFKRCSINEIHIEGVKPMGRIVFEDCKINRITIAVDSDDATPLLQYLKIDGADSEISTLTLSGNIGNTQIIRGKVNFMSFYGGNEKAAANITLSRGTIGNYSIEKLYDSKINISYLKQSVGHFLDIINSTITVRLSDVCIR